ncbi:MAG: SRPBCC family protein [Ramlibacter sp.]
MPLRRCGVAAGGIHERLAVKIGAPAAPEREAFPHHAESHGQVRASAARVFEHLDDHARLSAHMSRRSWRMGWSRMKLSLDEQAGRAAGSHIRLDGRILGVRLALEEVVTEHTPPTRKVWATVGTPRLLVIGPYQMGFLLVPAGGDVTLTVFIDYALPGRGPSRLLGRIFGHWYARWCTARMVADAQAAFSATT